MALSKKKIIQLKATIFAAIEDAIQAYNLNGVYIKEGERSITLTSKSAVPSLLISNLLMLENDLHQEHTEIFTYYESQHKVVVHICNSVTEAHRLAVECEKRYIAKHPKSKRYQT